MQRQDPITPEFTNKVNGLAHQISGKTGQNSASWTIISDHVDVSQLMGGAFFKVDVKSHAGHKWRLTLHQVQGTQFQQPFRVQEAQKIN